MTRFGGGADHRQHQPFGAHVHRPGNVVIVLRRCADDHRQVGRLEIADGALDRLEAETGMLEIEEHKVASCGFEDVADARRCELDDEMAELRRFAAGEILKPLRCHSALSPWLSPEPERFTIRA